MDRRRKTSDPFDGNGNIVSLINAADGTTSAEYAYGPFGEVIKAAGAAVATNPFGFSTKYQDAESGLLYYGVRYYQPQTGRWLSRDPIGEMGGKNVFAFSGNDELNHFDFLGREGAPTNPYVLEWHHNADQSIFAGTNGNPSYISQRGLTLASDVDIHSSEFGLMLRAGDHRLNAIEGTEFAGGLHNRGWSSLLKQWVDTLPKGKVITAEMLEEQICKMSKDSRFAEIFARGKVPRFSNYQAWQTRNAGRVCCNALMIMPMIFDMYFSVRDEAARNSYQNPYVALDSDGNMYSIGTKYKPAYTFTLFNWQSSSRFQSVDFHFVLYQNGPLAGAAIPINNQAFDILDAQMRQSGQTLHPLDFGDGGKVY